MPLVLDTNVVRNLGAGDVSPVGLLELRKGAVRIHLADGTLAELTHQLVQGAFPWEQWERAKTLLVDLVDADEPVLLGGRLGLHRAGLLSRHPGSETQISKELAIYEAGWTMLIGSKSAAQLRTASIKMPDQKLIVSLSANHVKLAHADHREEWATGFDQFRSKVVALSPDLPSTLPPRGDSKRALETYIGVSRAKTDEGRPWMDPRPSFRLDAFLAVDALLHLRHLREREPYDPAKNANDTFDCDLLKYLAFPAAICTSDSGLISKVEASGSWQRRWIVRPEDLLEPQVRVVVSDLRWPREAA